MRTKKLRDRRYDAIQSLAAPVTLNSTLSLFRQQVVIDHVEDRRDVETHQSEDRPAVNVPEDIVDDFHQSSLGRPAGEVSRLQSAVIW